MGAIGPTQRGAVQGNQHLQRSSTDCRHRRPVPETEAVGEELLEPSGEWYLKMRNTYQISTQEAYGFRWLPGVTPTVFEVPVQFLI